DRHEPRPPRTVTPRGIPPSSPSQSDRPSPPRPRSHGTRRLWRPVLRTPCPHPIICFFAPGQRINPCACATVGVTYNQMVVQLELSDEDVNRVFRALADATRRDIVRRTLVSEV